jgi:hypothetical protein
MRTNRITGRRHRPGRSRRPPCARCGHQTAMGGDDICKECQRHGYCGPAIGCRPDGDLIERRIAYYRDRAERGLPLFGDLDGLPV